MASRPASTTSQRTITAMTTGNEPPSSCPATERGGRSSTTESSANERHRVEVPQQRQIVGRDDHVKAGDCDRGGRGRLQGDDPGHYDRKGILRDDRFIHPVTSFGSTRLSSERIALHPFPASCCNSIRVIVTRITLFVNCALVRKLVLSI